MSSAAHRAFRAGAAWILAAAGWALWVRAPGSLLGALPLLFCPGWGLLRLLSVTDRRFGVAGGSLCLSVLVLGLMALLSAGHHRLPEQLGLSVHLIALLLTAAGGLRLVLHARWQARQPDHPAPMPLLPRGFPWCLLLMALAGALVLAAAPLGRPPDGSPLLVQASRALGCLHAGEEPFLAGVPQAPQNLLGAASASLSAATSLPPVVCVQLLALAALLATLLFVAESVSRLLGNRGALAGQLAALLGLHPLAGLFLIAAPQQHGQLSGPPPGYAPPITTALVPFVDGSDLALPLAFTAMLLSASLSVLRRSSFHVPRLAGCAAFGLALCRPSAALLLLPGWIVGIACAHLMRRRYERRAGSAPETPRSGEPRLLRAPFWALAVPVGAGGLGGLLLAGWPDLSGTPYVTTWRLLVAVAPAGVLFIPGVRHLNASPGREAWFFLGLLLVTLPLMVFLGPRGDHGEEAVVLLALLLAVPAAHGALKFVEWHGRRARLALGAVVVLLLPGPLAFLAERAGRPRALDESATPAVHSAALAKQLLQALDGVRQHAPRDAVLILPETETLPPSVPALLVLCSGRMLLAPAAGADPGDSALPSGRAGELQRRAELIADLPAGLTAPLLQLRGGSGLRSREFWAVHAGGPWSGFWPVMRAGDLLVERATPPSIVLVTVASLRAAALTPASMPALSALASRGVRCEQALTPLPETLPALTSLLTGLSPDEHGLREPGQRRAAGALSLAGVLGPCGYRTTAIVALDDDGGLLGDFEQQTSLPGADAEAVVDAALQTLAQADPRPLFLWVHLADPADALAPGGDLSAGAARARYDAAVAAVDRALSRLLASVPPQDLLVFSAPHGTNLDEHEAPFTHGHDLYEASLRVPLVLTGGGVAPGVFHGLTALQDVAALLLRGELPQRGRLFLQAARGAAPLWGLRTRHRKTVLARIPAAGATTAAAAGAAFDLVLDPDEVQALDPEGPALQAIEAWSRMLDR